MRKPGGYAQVIGPGQTKEIDTFTCHHCNKIVHVKAMADPADIGGMCKMCMQFICPQCLGQGCTPFEKKLLEMEAVGANRRMSYGE